jgi:hypothetical protein
LHRCESTILCGKPHWATGHSLSKHLSNDPRKQTESLYKNRLFLCRNNANWSSKMASRAPLSLYAAISQAVAQHGLSILAHIPLHKQTNTATTPYCVAQKAINETSAPAPTHTGYLIGNIQHPTSASFWPHFLQDAKATPRIATARHPLDTWTETILPPIASTFGADVWFVHTGPPYLPIISWLKAACGMKQSPMGIMMHPEYGLWCGFRAVLILPQTPHTAPSMRSYPAGKAPCDDCHDRPCLSACPVNAVQNGHYDVQTCRSALQQQYSHVENAPPPAHHAAAPCVAQGCLARMACPHQHYQYSQAQRQFHIKAFAMGLGLLPDAPLLDGFVPD